jgi:hypothetical protein
MATNGQMTEIVRPQMTAEKLASQTIEGVLVEGTRQTTTWPVGAQGNDRAITALTAITGTMVKNGHSAHQMFVGCSC